MQITFDPTNPVEVEKVLALISPETLFEAELTPVPERSAPPKKAEKLTRESMRALAAQASKVDKGATKAAVLGFAEGLSKVEEKDFEDLATLFNNIVLSGEGDE